MKDNILIIILVILLMCSIGLNIHFGLGGIIKLFSPTTHQHLHNHQEQFQGQMIINMSLVKGDKLYWRIVKWKEIESVRSYLNYLHPTSSYFTKIFIDSEDEYKYIMLIPNFLEQKEIK